MKLELFALMLCGIQYLRANDMLKHISQRNETLAALFNNGNVPKCLVKNFKEEEERKMNYYLTEKLQELDVEIECGANYDQRVFSENEFEIDEKGNLFDYRNVSYDKAKYCLRRIQNTQNKESNNSLEAVACDLPVLLNSCCFKNDQNEGCNAEQSNFSPSLTSLKILNISEDYQYEFFSVYNLKCSKNNTKYSLIENSSLTFVQNGKMIEAFDSKQNNKVDYCINQSDRKNNQYLVYYCETNMLLNNSLLDCKGNCVRKCCPEGYLYDNTLRKCDFVAEDSEWIPKFYTKDTLQLSHKHIHINFAYSFPLCKRFFLLNPSINSEDQFHILENGNLYVYKYKEAYPNNLYCTDYFRYKTNVTENALLCFPEMNTSTACTRIRAIVKPLLMVLSCVFLAITLFVYCILPDLYSKINGKCVISSTIALLLAYICLIIMHWGSGHITMTSCQLLGVFTQLFSLASFFWLNVMCFDVWRTLRAQQHVSSTNIYSAKKRFLKYSSYAWGLPFFISFVTFCIQFFVSDHSHGVLLPGFGTSGCFFPVKDSRPSWAYFYSFILVLMISNFCFFVHLLILLHKGRKQNDSALHLSNKRQVMWMKLYMKLFVVMGITWIFEILSWIKGSCSLWIWTDSLNALRGLLIFAIFVCKRTILKKLRTRSVFVSERLRELTKSLSLSTNTTKSSTKMMASRFYVDINEVETSAKTPTVDSTGR